MLAFGLGLQEMVILGGCFFFLLVPAIVLAVVLPIALRRKRPIEPDDASNPLARAKAAAAALTSTEREELRHWLEEPGP
jgi:hypothetical protein